MRRTSNALPEADEIALRAFIDEITERVRDRSDINPSVREVLVAALKQACRKASRPVPDLRSEAFVRADEARKRVAFDRAMREAVIAFLLDIEADEYPHAHVVDEHEGEMCIFARATEVFSKYIAYQRSPITHRRFKQFLLDNGLILDRVGERGIGGLRVGHLNMFRIDSIKALSAASAPATPAPPSPAAIDSNDAEELLALATVLKTYFRSPFKGRHFTAKVKKRDCLMVSPDDLHEFCQSHHATMEIAAHRLGPRGLKAAARRHGLLQADNYWLKRDGKMHGHLLAFDVKLVEDFYGRHAPGPD